MVSSTSSRTGGAEPAPQQFLLQGLHEVLGVVLVDLEVLVAGHPEDMVLDDLHALEQLARWAAMTSSSGTKRALRRRARNGAASGGTLTRAKWS